MEEAGGQSRLRAAIGEGGGEIFRSAGAAAGDNRDVDGVRDCPCQGDVVSLLRAVAVHRGEQEFAGAERFDLLRPLDRVEAGVDAPAADKYIPPLAGRASAGVDGDHNTLAAEASCAFAHDFRVADSGAVDAHFVGPGQQDGPHILDVANAAADGKRDEDGIGNPAHHFGNNVARLVGCGDIQEDQLVGAFVIVYLGLLHRIAGVDQVDKVDAFDDAPVFYIETGNDSFCQQDSLHSWQGL